MNMNHEPNLPSDIQKCVDNWYGYTLYKMLFYWKANDTTFHIVILSGSEDLYKTIHCIRLFRTHIGSVEISVDKDINLKEALEQVAQTEVEAK